MPDPFGKYHCYRCGKNLGTRTPPFVLTCRRCGAVMAVTEDGGDVALTTAGADPRIIRRPQ